MKDYPVNYIELSTGENIAYRQAGNKDRVFVLIHGNMSSSVHMQVLMEELEDDFTVYAIDMAGFGGSSYNRQLDTLHDFSRDITEFILKKDLKDVYILGWSAGGGAILETAADIPERIKKVFLMSSVGIQGYPMYKKNSLNQPILTEMIYKREDIESDPVQVVPVIKALESGNDQFMKLVWDATIYSKVKPPKEDYDKYFEATMKQRNIVDMDVALANFNMTNEFNGVVEGSGRMDKIKAPVVILHGEKDIIVPIDFAKLTKEKFGDQADFIIFKGASHSLLTDDIDKFMSELAPYIK